MTEEEETKTVRLVVLLPEDTKQKVQAIVGKRGMSPFAVQAIEEKLANNPDGPNLVRTRPNDDPKVAQGLARDLQEARYVAQALANAIAEADSPELLEVVSLPDWINSEGWPEFTAAQVGRPRTEEITEPFPEMSDPEMSEPEEDRPSIADLPAREPGQSSGDFLASVLQRADELGISRASDLPRPSGADAPPDEATTPPVVATGDPEEATATSAPESRRELDDVGF